MHAVRSILLLTVMTFHADAQPAPAPRLADFDIVEIALPERAAVARIGLRAHGRQFDLVVAENLELLESLPGRVRGRLAASDRFLRGRLSGIEGSWVRLNRIGGRVSGAFYDGQHLYLIDRAESFSLPGTRAAASGATMVYRLADLKIDAAIDPGGVHPMADSARRRSFDDYATFGAHLRELAALEGSAAMAMPVTIVSDARFADKFGADTDSIVVGRINLVDGIYSQQVGVGIQLWHHEILARNGTLAATDASDLLYQFRTWMRSGAGAGVPFKGLAHLFTGRDLDGGTVGIAFLGVLCSSSSGYGVNQDYGSDTYSALIFAHELGHNFGAYHDNGSSCPDGTFAGIMNSRINGEDEFSQCSIDAMGPVIASAGCLVASESAEAIFDNGFER
jgi:hypothetical protein